MQFESTDTGIIAWCDPLAQQLTPTQFQADYWQQQNAIIGQSKGRFTTWFVENNHQRWVLRHYWRGGLMAKLSDDAYVFTGISRTRAIAELALLEKLFDEGFPVPRPIAANVERFGIWYRADLIIELIDGAKDLVAYLSTAAMSDSQWQQLGALIAKFHNRGVYHADLNAKNILLAEAQFYLIDFDRGVIKTPAKQWQQANLSRLLRSFYKEQAKLSTLNFNESNWQQLLYGYQQAIN
ncbi:3-deoxy-D-manno-octulosonic acid kinase [Shewanella sp. 3_MG-2023]|uniref:3-deoxy-D-manno-octulosonic acid kinase n=1 Tax=Shewanella sp. 3_MG-2023 TaxID=3062635 RepID=UPI0026E47211|nr:3-deoxy-D-manno-octulosonic acid kinase [Shewanella sp. 3_MG-2023]MDO6775170.1 3-deoxy-D-manno-octulosonic acid kinase [Shewanella sp. 3_MG-2023]